MLGGEAIAAGRTPLNLWDTAFPALGRARVGRNDVLLDSPPNLRGRLFPFVRLVQRCFGAIRLLRDVHVRLVAQRLCTGLNPGGTETPRRSPASRAYCFSACLGS